MPSCVPAPKDRKLTPCGRNNPQPRMQVQSALVPSERWCAWTDAPSPSTNQRDRLDRSISKLFYSRVHLVTRTRLRQVPQDGDCLFVGVPYFDKVTFDSNVF